MEDNDGAAPTGAAYPQYPQRGPLGAHDGTGALSHQDAHPGAFAYIPGPSLVGDVQLYVSAHLGHTDWIYHPTQARAFIISPTFYLALRRELPHTSLTGNAGPCERALYGAVLAIGWVYL